MSLRSLLVASVVLGSIGTAQPPLRTLAVDDGPHLFHRKDGSVEAIWVAGGKVEKQQFKKGAPIKLPRFAHLLGHELVLRAHEPEPYLFDLPKKLLVISDIEGEYDGLVRFLRKNKVIDEKGRWSFGKGHLVTVGDMVDRGDKATEVLWLMYRLCQEAKAAGGRVHYVLGNHEVMVMSADTRYIAPKYRVVCATLGMPYERLVAKDTEIGRWLRSCHTMVRLGDLLFVHAGISPTIKWDIKTINTTVRETLGIPLAEIHTLGKVAREIVWSTRGPLWYRGYFKLYAEVYAADFGPMPKTPAIDALLTRFGAKSIIIGHTKVKTITSIYGGRRVLAIDTPWTDLPNVRGLWIVDGTIRQVDITGEISVLRGVTPEKAKRP